MNLNDILGKFERNTSTSDEPRLRPGIASRMIVTDAALALVLVAAAIFVVLYGLSNEKLMAEQALVTQTETFVKEQRRASFEAHVAATALRTEWADAEQFEQEMLLSDLQDASAYFNQAAEQLLANDAITSNEAFESGPAAMEQLSKLMAELLNANAVGESTPLRSNLDVEFTGNYRFLLSILNDLEDIAATNASLFQEKTAAEAQDLVAILAIGVALIVCALAIRLALVMKWFAKPAHALAKVTSEFAQGETEREIPEMPVRELQNIADALSVFRDMTFEAESLRVRSREADLKARLAQVELDRKESETQKLMELERRKTFEEMAEKFENSVSSVVHAANSAAQELHQSAEQLDHAINEASDQAVQITSASSQATMNVEFVANAIEELSSFVLDISNQVNEQSTLSHSAQQESQAGVSNAQTLAAKASNIESIAKLIRDTAEQTNILALNATIEAVHAGESGVGFSVVAAEVKNLANQSHQSASEIGDVLTTLNDEVHHAVGSIGNVATSLEEIGTIASRVTDAMQKHERVAQDISANASEAATGTGEVNDKIASLATNTEKAGKLSGDVKSAANQLGTQAKVLEGAVKEFVEFLRAA